MQDGFGSSGVQVPARRSTPSRVAPVGQVAEHLDLLLGGSLRARGWTEASRGAGLGGLSRVMDSATGTGQEGVGNECPSRYMYTGEGVGVKKEKVSILHCFSIS